MKKDHLKKHFKVIGLTGGIASGKSSVAEFLKSLGYPVVDADKIVHSLLAPGGKAHDLVIQRFGTADRKELRNRVFSREEERKALEAILHPLVAEESERLFQELADKNPLLFYEATLLIEAGRHRGLAGVWVTTSPEDLRLQRLQKRNGYTKEEGEKIIRSQSSDAFRLAHATLEIKNEGTLEDLHAQVRTALDKLTK